ncbi:hypothetical protein [Nitrosomonas ureae]|uniref:hypothetical protein n=2 Tax=Pseudomonadota TaxID=1224 RepID=UPI000B329B90|nr:hypothetical protein [Nitrosomonas ureae]
MMKCEYLNRTHKNRKNSIDDIHYSTQGGQFFGNRLLLLKKGGQRFVEVLLTG